MRKTWDSSKTECITAFSSRADARSRPNGFSNTIFASRWSPASPIRWTMSAYAAGGTAASKNRLPSVPNSASIFSR